ncbi:MAG TPA: hypothetical protein VNM87_02920 [Candidatus Udaeobacter sp.]|nr:hypothetical protein [Candidatus Udaeobacter sp.]
MYPATTPAIQRTIQGVIEGRQWSSLLDLLWRLESLELAQAIAPWTDNAADSR